MNRIYKYITFTVLVLLLFFFLFPAKAIEALNCCTGNTGTWYNGCCYSGGDMNNCCSLSDFDPSIPGCELSSCGSCSSSNPPCNDCTLPNCPAPFTNSGLDQFKFERMRSCNKTGSCSGKTYGDCYEPRTCIIGDPACPDPEDPQIPPDGLIHIFPSGDATTRGCTSSTYTGQQVNNPIRMVGTFQDPNGANDIEAMYIWLKNSTVAPVTPSFIDLNSDSGQTGRVCTNSSYGFLMHKEGGNWVPYIANLFCTDNKTNDKWVKASYANNRFGIKGPNGQNIAEVVVNSINTINGNTIQLDFSLDYTHIESANRPAEGTYNIFAMANDVFGFTPYDNYPGIDVSSKFPAEKIRYYDKWIDSGKDWSFDFTAPTVEGMSSQVEYPTYLQYSWNSNDTTSGLYALVVNAYISDNTPLIETDKISEMTLSAKGTKTIALQPYSLSHTPSDNLVGNLSSGYLAKSVGISSNTDNQSIRVNTNTNRKGSLIVFATAFDNACNYTASHELYNLEDWIITYGGLLYSQGGVNFSVKNMEDPSLWDQIPFLKRITPSRADITSELFGGNTTATSSILDKLVKTANLKSYVINPFKAYKPVNFYTDLKSTFERRESGISNIRRISNTSTIVGNLTDYGAGSSIVLDRSGDLTVGNANYFNCNGNGIFFVSGNLTIQNGISNSNKNRDACIFVVQGNVNINGGSNMSTPVKMGYDEINAYILANGNIQINTDSTYDGLYINGGIQVLGSVIFNRYLGINNRNTYPVLVVDNNSKYGILSSTIFGNPVDLIKTEVGFKPF